MKATVSCNGFAFLLFDISPYHFICNLDRAECPAFSIPRVFPPKLLHQMRRFRQQNSHAYTFKPLHNFATILRRPIRDKHVDMISAYLYPGISSLCSIALCRKTSLGQIAPCPVNTRFHLWFFRVQIKCIVR